MLHHERLRPPSHDYPADEWNVIEKAFHPEFLAQLETMLALGNGYLGMRGCPEEGGPNAENATLINGFYETRPIVYGEEAYGFAKTGQTICNVTDSKIIKLFVDDEPFWLPDANLLRFGGGNVNRLDALPPRCRAGHNANAFRGGFRLWTKDSLVPPDLPPGRARAGRKT
jgi:Glycosyl hydrolase family 65, N-terminal domain